MSASPVGEELAVGDGGRLPVSSAKQVSYSKELHRDYQRSTQPERKEPEKRLESFLVRRTQEQTPSRMRICPPCRRLEGEAHDMTEASRSETCLSFHRSQLTCCTASHDWESDNSPGYEATRGHVITGGFWHTLSPSTITLFLQATDGTAVSKQTFSSAFFRVMGCRSLKRTGGEIRIRV